MRSVFKIAAVVATLAATPVMAAPFDVLGGVLGTYNVFTFGDMGSAANPYASDAQGAVAVGGNAYFQDFTVAGVTNHGVNALTVRGNLNQLRAQDGGNVFVGGNADFHDGSQGGATVQGTLTVNGTLVNPPTSYVGPRLTGPNPIDFDSVRGSILQASALLGTSSANGTVTYNNQFNQKELALVGTNATINTFNVSGAQLGRIGGVQPDYSDGGGSFHLDIPDGATAIINVSGADINFGHPGNFGFFCGATTCDESDASRILFNFLDAQTLNMASVLGSILAPFADITFTNGQALGSVIANSLGGPLYTTGEFHDVPYTGVLATVPLPSSALILALGLVMLLAMRQHVSGARRRRAKANPKEWLERARLSRTDWSQHPDW